MAGDTSSGNLREEWQIAMLDNKNLIEVLLHQRENGIDDSVYKMIQCDFAYNSNHMEGSRLSPEQTRMVFARKTISGDNIALDDILEAMNHFEALDVILDTYDEPLCEDMLFQLHRTLKAGTTQARNPLYSVGAYKQYANVIGDEELETTPPEKVAEDINQLLSDYEKADERDFDSLLSFHVRFERIHPFSDGNGRIGRLLLFKECLRNDITPYIITDDLRAYYIRGLKNFRSEKGWLRDTCLTAQDRFIARYMPLAESYAKALESASRDNTVSLKQECKDCIAASHDSDLNREHGSIKDDKTR